MNELTFDEIEMVSGGDDGGLSAVDGAGLGSAIGGAGGLAAALTGSAGGLAVGDAIAVGAALGGVIGITAAIGGIAVYAAYRYLTHVPQNG